jgi:hypothetical protein
MAARLRNPPTRYSEAFPEQLIELAAKGYSLAGFAGAIGIERGTVNDWAASFPEFGQACARAKAARAYAWETKAIRAVDSGLSGPLTFIAFALKNCAPDDWREKIEVQSNHTFTLIGLIEESLAMSGRAIDVTPAKPLIDQDKPIEPDTSR